MVAAQSASAFRCGSDELGIYAQSSVDPTVFSENAILKTAYWFTDQYYLISQQEPHNWVARRIELRLKQGDDPRKTKAACGEFWNGLLDQEVRQKVLTKPPWYEILLLRRPFSTPVRRCQTTVFSNESRLRIARQSYVHDPPMRVNWTNGSYTVHR